MKKQDEETNGNGNGKREPVDLSSAPIKEKDRTRLLRLMEDRAEIQNRASELEKQKKDLNTQIIPLMRSLRLDAVRDSASGVTMTVYEGSSSHISKEKLLELGVSAKVIQRAVVETPYVTVRINQRRESDKKSERE